MKRRNIAGIILTGLILLVASIYPAREVSANQEIFYCSDAIKVMPLGDSITTGKYSGANTTSPGGDFDDIGYREDLYTLLASAGYSVDFVGTNSNGVFAEPKHEGHNGYTDADIAKNIYNESGGDNWLSQNPPDVILLHIGTNELDDDASEVENILDEIVEYKGDTGKRVIVFLARIIDMVPNNPVVNQFNNAVESMASARAEFGVDLFMVDMEDGAGITYSIWPGDPTGDFIDDGLHLYATGYTKMAAAWMDAFDNLCRDIYLPIVLNSYHAKNYLWD